MLSNAAPDTPLRELARMQAQRHFIERAFETVSYTHLDVYKRQGLGRRVPRRCGGNEVGRRRTARRPSGTSSPWESTWRALSAVCLNTEQLLVGTCRKAVTTYLQGWL